MFALSSLCVYFFDQMQARVWCLEHGHAHLIYDHNTKDKEWEKLSLSSFCSSLRNRFIVLLIFPHLFGFSSANTIKAVHFHLPSWRTCATRKVSLLQDSFLSARHVCPLFELFHSLSSQLFIILLFVYMLSITSIQVYYYLYYHQVLVTAIE